MYKSFEIKNFKCFEHLKLENLARVNLIAGKNSVGKSALLEALDVHCDGHDPWIVAGIKYRRRPEYESPEPHTIVSLSRSCFRDFDTGATIELGSTGDGDVERRMRLRLVRHDERMPGWSEPWALELVAKDPGKKEERFELFTSVDKGIRVDRATPPRAVPAVTRGALRPIDVKEASRRFGELVKSDKLKGDELAQILKIVEPRLERVELLPDEGTHLMHGHISGISKPVPLPEMGDGILRVAGLIIAMGHYENGVLFADEIENGLHYSILEDVWRVIAEAARQFNVQVFATTHSFECVEAAHRAFHGEHANEFRLFRLERVKDKIRAFDYDPDVLEAAIQTNLEVR